MTELLIYIILSIAVIALAAWSIVQLRRQPKPIRVQYTAIGSSPNGNASVAIRVHNCDDAKEAVAAAIGSLNAEHRAEMTLNDVTVGKLYTVVRLSHAGKYTATN